MSKQIVRQRRVKYVLLGIVFSVIAILFFLNRDNFILRFENNFLRSDNYASILTGLGNTFIITISGFTFGFILGTTVCIVQGIQSNNYFLLGLKQVLGWYVALFRGTPSHFLFLTFLLDGCA